MANDVKVLKLISNGEEIITKMTESDNGFLILEKPMHLEYYMKDGGIGMVPWIFSGTSEKITVSIDHIITEDVPKEQHEKNYLAAVTGLSL